MDLKFKIYFFTIKTINIACLVLFIYEYARKHINT